MTASRKTKTFECEAMSHDLFSTKFCKDGKVDTLSRTDYKEPPVVAYENKMQEVICLNFQGNKGMCGTSNDGKCFSLNAMHGHDVHVVCMRENEWEK